MNLKVRKIYDHICYDCHHGAQKGRCRRLPEKQLRQEIKRELRLEEKSALSRRDRARYRDPDLHAALGPYGGS